MAEFKTSEVELAQLHQDIDSLLGRARSALEEADSEPFTELAKDIPTSVLHDSRPPTVVFAGQYSAGKSSLIKALTGLEEIEVGIKITTEEVCSYMWNGIEIIDTPGIETGLRSDHDEKSYEAIARADLLVYVITNELMDDHIAGNFRKLAVDGGKAHEMMLVVNKMGRHDLGLCDESKTIVLEALDEVLAPYSTDEIRVAFTDADLALSSQTETDPEFAGEDWEDSGFERFQQQLDEFVSDQQLAGRFTSSLYELEHILIQARAEACNDDPATASLRQMLVEKRRLLRIAATDATSRATSRIQRTASEVRRIGNDVANEVDTGADPDKINSSLQTAKQQVEDKSRELNIDVQQLFEEVLAETNDELANLAQSEFAQFAFDQIVDQLDIDGEAIPEDVLRQASKAGEVARGLGEFLVKNSFDPKSTNFGGLLKMRNYSGTSTHGTVKKVGEFFNYKFKPWEAVKWTKRIATAGRVLTVVGGVLAVAGQIADDRKTKEREQEFDKARNAVRSGFNDTANTIEMRFDDETGTFVDATFETEVAAVDKQLRELDARGEQLDKMTNTIDELLEQTRTLIVRTHHTAGSPLPN